MRQLKIISGLTVTREDADAYSLADPSVVLPLRRIIHRPFMEQMLLDVFHFVNHATQSRTQLGKMTF